MKKKKIGMGGLPPTPLPPYGSKFRILSWTLFISRSTGLAFTKLNAVS